MKHEVVVGSVTAIHRRTTINKTPLCALRPLCETAGRWNFTLPTLYFLRRMASLHGAEGAGMTPYTQQDASLRHLFLPVNSHSNPLG